VNAAFWKQLPAYELGKVDGYVKRNPVKVRFAYNSEALYFRFDAVDDDLVDESPAKLERSGLFIYADTVELFLRPVKSHGYWEFHFSASGKNGAIFFPSRGRRMPSNVYYLPMDGLEFHRTLFGTLNDMRDKDKGWVGIARIPYAGIAGRCPLFRSGAPLEVQVTSIAYSVYADADERTQLHHTSGCDRDPHYLPDWGILRFLPR